MLNNFLDAIPENRLYVALLLLSFLFLVIIFRSENVRGQMKKLVVYFLILAAIGFGYYLFTGKSPSEIPAAIDYYFNGPQATPEKASHKYYKDPEKRYGKQLGD